MKIEKLSDNTIRISLTKTDFARRHIDSTNLKITSKSYRNFISDIVYRAENELGFEVKSGKLLVETHPDKKPGDFIVIVKVVEPSNNDTGRDMVKDLTKLKSMFLESLKNSISPQEDLPVEGLFPDPKSDVPSGDAAGQGLSLDVGEYPGTIQEKETIYDHYDVICFDDFECLVAFCKSFTTGLKAATALYLYHDAYYVIIRISKTMLMNAGKIESRALEFNGMYVPCEFVLPVLQEHGTPIIKKAAIKTIAEKY